MIRILHVATMMGSGGLEKWLVDLVAEMSHEPYENHILVQSTDFGLHGQRARRLGISVIPIAHGHQPVRFARDFLQVLQTYGPFHVVHSHVHTFNGLVLTLAKLKGVPVRVAHAHNDTSSEHRTWPRKLYAWISRRLISLTATNGFGVSEAATRDLFGSAYGGNSRWQVLPCGISLEPFRTPYERAVVAADLQLPLDAFVIAQVGRLAYMKNQAFSLQLLAQLDAPNAILLLLGDGDSETEYRRLAENLGISQRVIFAGARADVPRILCGAVDLFLFPSRPGEGAPIALIEAQAAGLPCVISENIPSSSVVIPALVQQLRLDQGTQSWINAIDRIRKTGPGAYRVSRDMATRLVADSAFSIASNYRVLSAVYTSSA